MLAYVVARSCAERSIKIDKDEAIAIARKEIDFTPNCDSCVQVRLVKQGFNSKPHWAVSLSRLGPDGRRERVTVVLVDARSAQVVQVTRSR